MPRLDPTFSDKDLIRFWANNLTKEEQEVVRCFFLLGELSRTGSLTTFQRLTRFIFELFRRTKLGELIDFVISVIGAFRTPPNVAACIEELKKRNLELPGPIPKQLPGPPPKQLPLPPRRRLPAPRPQLPPP